jgi:hypothetical protein
MVKGVLRQSVIARHVKLAANPCHSPLASGGERPLSPLVPRTTLSTSITAFILPSALASITIRSGKDCQRPY